MALDWDPSLGSYEYEFFDKPYVFNSMPDFKVSQETTKNWIDQFLPNWRRAFEPDPEESRDPADWW